MSFNREPFHNHNNQFPSFDPEERLSQFRKRFSDLTSESDNRAKMFFENPGRSHLNGWPYESRLNDMKMPTHDSSFANSSRNSASNSRKGNRTEMDGNRDGVPVKVNHIKTDSSSSDQSHDYDTCSISSSSSHHSGSSGHSSGRPGDESRRTHSPRIHHIPITIEPRDGAGSSSSGYATDSLQHEQAANLSRSSSSSSHQSGHSGVSSHSGHNIDMKSPTQVRSSTSSSNNSTCSDNASQRESVSPNGSVKACHVIPITVEEREEKDLKKPSIHEQIPQVKVAGLGQSTSSSGNKKASGPYVTRIPVLNQTNHVNEMSPNNTLPTNRQQQARLAKFDPLEVIKSILTDVEKWEKQVMSFEGNNQDKQYKFLDEMLTRCMIKLDNIETHGREDIRKARKESIMRVQKCISLLDSKSKANLANEVVKNSENDKEDKEVIKEGEDENMIESEKEIVNESKEEEKVEAEVTSNNEEKNKDDKSKLKVTHL